ncbi:Precorrin-4 C(11)-methyltransferase [Methylobrevis pamukkalensis]|uniref:Precorrin-4 C(11)-methyltransferase n=1 Tax=Methylobrevis pamukkalensis TaxID=1439726 RepID=A0A1E3H0L3_9HYPH|nr:Precorrin-4 C(11)-methyltransferase [Methylobrevis pamukkalensis]
MTVHFIGAGPGAADLITLRGRDLLAASPVCLYAGSLVPQALLAHCPPDARIIDTAPLSLDEIVAEFARAHARGEDVARLHSGACRCGAPWASSCAASTPSASPMT